MKDGMFRQEIFNIFIDISQEIFGGLRTSRRKHNFFFFFLLFPSYSRSDTTIQLIYKKKIQFSQ